jgi:hypothetical protein
MRQPSHDDSAVFNITTAETVNGKGDDLRSMGSVKLAQSDGLEAVRIMSTTFASFFHPPSVTRVFADAWRSKTHSC